MSGVGDTKPKTIGRAELARDMIQILSEILLPQIDDLDERSEIVASLNEVQWKAWEPDSEAQYRQARAVPCHSCRRPTAKARDIEGIKYCTACFKRLGYEFDENDQEVPA